MVEGQPVAVQSPASQHWGQGEAEAGRAASMPGGTQNVACTSLTIVAFSKRAVRAAGKNSPSSATARAIAYSRDRAAKVREALITTST